MPIVHRPIHEKELRRVLGEHLATVHRPITHPELLCCLKFLERKKVGWKDKGV